MLGGESLKSAMRCGFSMAQIGEFSFIIASLGLSLGVISDFLYPVVVAVSVITTFLTPYMIRLATPAYSNLESHLPNKLINSLNQIAVGSHHTQEQSKWKKLLTQMAINTVVYSISHVGCHCDDAHFRASFYARTVAGMGTPLVC